MTNPLLYSLEPIWIYYKDELRRAQEYLADLESTKDHWVLVALQRERLPLYQAAYDEVNVEIEELFIEMAEAKALDWNCDGGDND